MAEIQTMRRNLAPVAFKFTKVLVPEYFKK